MNLKHPAAALALVSCASWAFTANAGECPVQFDLNGGVNNYVYSLIEYNGQLIAGGDFTLAGGLSVGRIAKWDGSNWASIGATFTTVRHMFVHEGKLIVSNGGNIVASWDGSNWTSHTAPSFGGIECFGVYNGDFLIGGQWFVNNDFINVLRWDLETGQWQAIGAPGTFGTYKVKALAVHEGKLIAGGDFFIVNGELVDGLAWWDETEQQWRPFEQGLSDNGQIYAMTIYNGDLIVAGAFTHAGGIYSRGVARWNSTTGWQGLAGGVSGHVNTVTVYNGDLIIGGYFTAAGSAQVNNIARWNDSIGDWQQVGDGVTNCCGYGASVYTVAVADGTLYAGGWFGFGQEDSPQRIVGWHDCQSTPCAADIAGSDGQVNVTDLLTVINSWGVCPGCAADITGDNQVNVSDLLAVINNWGTCP